jgi:carbamoyltransferase
MSGRHCLGVHIGHDRGAALVSDGELVASVAEERLDRKKHSNSAALPMKSIRTVLNIAGIRPTDLGAVGISDTKVEICRALPLLRHDLRDLLQAPHLDVIGVDHHDCHAWSAYCTFDGDDALIVVADGAGEVIGDRIEAESVYVGSGAAIELTDRRLQEFSLAQISRRNSYLFPYMNDIDRKKEISLGHKYEQFTYIVGFSEREAGKTMGLSAYGTPMYEIAAPALQDVQFSLTFEDGLAEVDRIWNSSGQPWYTFVEQRRADIAATGQKLLETYMVALLNALNPTGAHRTLCAAGGVFLNCQMNSLILRETRFDEMHVFPAAGDDGQCVGAAFYAYNRTFGEPKRGSASLPYLGQRYGDAAIRDAVDRVGLRAQRLDDGQLADRVAADLAAGKVVGLLRGRSELGPRALCHRSILADPRLPGMKDDLNHLKGRELFRPFAPVVTAENQAEYFEQEHPSPYMLFATRLRPQFRDGLPAVVHVDGSSRVQAVTQRKEPFVHALLRSFERHSGFPILLNTSFNLAGDPIVESPHDAIATYRKSGIDVLVMENFYLDGKDSQPILHRGPASG